MYHGSTRVHDGTVRHVRCSVRNPITLSGVSARLPAPAAYPRQARDRDPPLAVRGSLTMTEPLRLPTYARHLRRRPDPAARTGPHGRPHGPGRVRRAGLLAGGPAAAAPSRSTGVQGGARRAGRPRVHAHGSRGPADLPLGTGLVRGRWRQGLLGGGSRFLGVTEDCGQFLDAVIVDVEGGLPTDDAVDTLAQAALTRTREAGRFVPGLGHPVHKVEDPRTPGPAPDRRGGAARAAPAPVQGGRPGPRAGARPPAPAQRRGGMPGPPSPTSACQ